MYVAENPLQSQQIANSCKHWCVVGFWRHRTEFVASLESNRKIWIKCSVIHFLKKLFSKKALSSIITNNTPYLIFLIWSNFLARISYFTTYFGALSQLR